jgi:WD40 repeat protein/tRNA A-37 threonylcarbamoyl transferase component Bud32
MAVDAKRVQDVFLAAVQEADASRWASLLDQQCASEPELRLRVEALLQAHEAPASILLGPAVSPSEAGTLAEPAGGADVSQTLDFLASSAKSGSLGRLDHYEVLEVVGHGGMGVVLKAFDEKLHRVSAIKVLAPQMAANGTARKRFVREAQAAAAVAHDHVVAIHAVEEAGPVPYLVMHYVAGISLEDRIKQGGPLEVKEILRIGIQTAAGLAAAHAQGLVHRDVKPANILLENGVQRVKITDFGLARAVDDASLTQAGVIAGTPMYMSPEQARGEAVDHRADLFSLGSVLYTLCTGHRPFRASGTMAVLKRVCEDTPHPIREINPEIPDWLTAIVAKLHAKDPAARFQSAAEVAELLSQHLAHLQQPQNVPQPACVGQVSNLQRTRQVGNLTPKSWPVAAAAVLLLGAGAVALIWILGRGEPDSSAPPGGSTIVKASDAAFDALKREDIPPSLLALAGSGDPAQAPPELVAMLGDGRFALPRRELTYEMTQSPDGRLLALPWGYSVLLYDAKTGDLLRMLTGHTDRATCGSFSPDSKHFACGSAAAIVKVWDVQTGKELASWGGHRQAVTHVAFAPNGEYLVSCSPDGTAKVWDIEGRELHTLQRDGDNVGGYAKLTPDGMLLTNGPVPKVWNPATGALLETLQGHTSRVFYVAIQADGKLAATGSDKEVILWDTQTWKQLHVLQTSGSGLVAFTPDGATLVTCKFLPAPDEPWVLSRWDVQTGNKLGTTTLPKKGGEVAIHLSQDGRTLFAMNRTATDSHVGVYEIETGKELMPHQGHEGFVLCVAVSRDGRRLASGGGDRRVRLWDLGSWKKSEPLPPVRTLTTHEDSVRAVAFSPDGKLLASGGDDGAILLWDGVSGERIKQLPGRLPNTHCIAFSPDGKILAAGGNSIIRLWDLTSGKALDSIRGHTGVVRDVAFSPDGKLLSSSGVDRLLRLCEMPGGALLDEQRTDAVLTSVGFSADGKLLGAGCDAPQSLLHLWEVIDRSSLKARADLRAHTSHVSTFAFPPNGSLIATGAHDGTVRFWDVTGKVARSLAIGPGPFGNGIFKIAFSPEGRYLVTGNGNGTISILRVPQPPVANAPGSPLKLPDPAELAGQPAPADALKRENIPAELLARAGGGDPQKAPSELVAVAVIAEGELKQLLAITISPDGKTLAAAGQDKVIKLWDLGKGKLASEPLTGHQTHIRGLAISPDGRRLASGGMDQTVTLWDMSTGKGVHTLTGHTGWINRVMFSPDGKTLASCGEDGLIKLWDAVTGRPVRTVPFPGSVSDGVAFSPDSKMLAACCYMSATVRLYDVATGWQVGELLGRKTGTRCVTWHPDGRRLAASGEDQTIQVWDLSNWRSGDASPAAQVLEGHRSAIGSLAWRADGGLLASQSAVDCSLLLWDLAARPPRFHKLQPFPKDEPWLNRIAFTPEGRHLAVANGDGTIYILRLAELGEVYQVPSEPQKFQPRFLR